jgi:adenylate cyclase
MFDPKILLRTAEQEAERLHAAVRTVVLAAFWGLLLISGEGHHHEAIAFAALGAYSGLTLLTWVAVLRGWHDGRFSAVMVTLDVALVVLQVWLLALSAGLPDGHLFMLPPATIIFLVVAQNALRFQPTPVLLGGLVAATMLSATEFLPLAPVASLPTAPTGHGTSPSIYWPALPIVTLSFMTLVLWFQARRTRALVDRAVGCAERAGNLARFFSPTIARCLAVNGTENRGRGERCRIAVLFADIRGFTGMAEDMAPDELGRFLVEFRTRAAACIFSCNGTVDKFLGDGVLAVFGAPEPNTDCASCALRCATYLHDAMRTWSAERAVGGEPNVRLSIGAHFGEAFVGILGASPMLEFTAIGDTVNVAQRLQRLATDTGSETVISDALRSASKGSFDPALWVALEDMRLAGRSATMRVWRLTNNERPRLLPRAPRPAMAQARTPEETLA